MVYSPLRPDPNNKRGERSALAHAFGAPSSGEGSTSGGYRVKLKRSPNPEKKKMAELEGVPLSPQPNSRCIMFVFVVLLY